MEKRKRSQLAIQKVVLQQAPPRHPPCDPEKKPPVAGPRRLEALPCEPQHIRPRGVELVPLEADDGLGPGEDSTSTKTSRESRLEKSDPCKKTSSFLARGKRRDPPPKKKKGSELWGSNQLPSNWWFGAESVVWWPRGDFHVPSTRTRRTGVQNRLQTANPN